MPANPIWGPAPPCPTCAETAARLREAERERDALKAERGEWADGQAALMGSLQDAEAAIGRVGALADQWEAEFGKVHVVVALRTALGETP